MLETRRLDGKTAVVTGAGRGLGQAMAKALARAGAEVVCSARTQVQIDDTVRQICDAGGRALAVCTDVTDSAQVNRLVDTCVDTYGKSTSWSPTPVAADSPAVTGSSGNTPT